MGYQPLVIEKCKEFDVWGPDENCRFSFWALAHFPQWVAEQKPDVVHFNFGVHDAKILPDGQHHILLAQYRLCLQRFIDAVKELENTRMIWATTTPLYTPEEGKPMAKWQVMAKAEIKQYNTAANEIVKREGLPVNDLHEVIIRNDFAKCLTEDGCHMTEYGNEVLSEAVVKALATF